MDNGLCEQSEKLCDDISMLEKEADVTRREIISAFLEGSLLAQTRKEILQIVESVDKIANKCQNLAIMMLIEKVEFPDFIKPKIKEIGRLTKEQVKTLTKTLNILFDDYDQLINAHSILEELNKLEGQIDEIELAAIKELYKADLKLEVKNQVKYFLSHIADISDLIEDISDNIQIMVVFRRV